MAATLSSNTYDAAARRCDVLIRVTSRGLRTILVMLCGLAWLSSAQAGLYRWVDAEGNVFYSDRPPPENDSAHSVLNKRGLEIRQINRAKTAEEVAAETAEAERRRAEHMVEQRARHRDKVLLKTFTTERDLLLTRDDRLSAIDGAILLSEKRIKTWNQKLDDVELRIDSFGSEDQVPPRLKEERDIILRRIGSSEEYLLEKMKERERTAEQFEQDLARYRELKAEG